MRSLKTALLAGALGFLSLSAQAAIVTYEFNGVLGPIDDVNGLFSTFYPGAGEGDFVSAMATIDTAAVPTPFFVNENFGLYSLSPSDGSISGDLNGTPLVGLGQVNQVAVDIATFDVTTIPEWSFRDNLQPTSSDWIEMQIALVDTTGSISSTDYFVPTSLDGFDVVFRFLATSDAGEFLGIISQAEGDATINVIPIPAAVWLFGSALGLLGWVRRRTT